MKTLETLLLDELADVYDAEHRLLKALPKMAKVATHQELREAFLGHLTETEGHVEKLKLVFKTFGAEARGKKCEAIVGLLKEGDEIAADNEGHPTINAALISAAQKVEHYEIGSYGCLRTWAELLGNPKAAKILGEILSEEKAADEKLTLIAISTCNPSADGTEDVDEEGAHPDGSAPKQRARRAGPKARAKSNKRTPSRMAGAR